MLGPDPKVHSRTEKVQEGELRLWSLAPLLGSLVGSNGWTRRKRTAGEYHKKNGRGPAGMNGVLRNHRIGSDHDSRLGIVGGI